MDKKWTPRLYFLSLLALGISGLYYGRYEQEQNYHQFADNRMFLGIPNGIDVMSNLAIVFPGIAGIAFVHERQKNKYQWADSFEPTILYCLFFGMILTFFGSVWFHLDPSNSTLVWDRLGMVIIMACYCSLIIFDRFDSNLAGNIHFPLIIIGFSSVLVWQYFDDLRFYFLFKVQVFFLVLILLKYGNKSYDRAKDYLLSLALFGLATVFEFTDEIVFDTLVIISGHSLKHIFAGVGLWWIMAMTRDRTLIGNLE